MSAKRLLFLTGNTNSKMQTDRVQLVSKGRIKSLKWGYNFSYVSIFRSVFVKVPSVNDGPHSVHIKFQRVTQTLRSSIWLLLSENRLDAAARL